MKTFRFLAALAVIALPLAAQTFPTSSVLPTALPDGTGACTPGAPLPLSVPVTGVAGATGITLDFTFSPAHTWHGDIQCIVTAPSGATSEVMIPGCTALPDDSSDVGGPYVLADGAAQSFDAAAVAAPGLIPAGTYGPDNGLNALLSCGNPNGTWTVTFRDHFTGDVGTVSAVALTFGAGTPANSFVVCQTGPGANLNLIHNAGAAPITYTNAVTIATPGSVPLGWWFGLDCPLGGPLGLIDQLSNPAYGPLFIGSLAAGGQNVISFAIPPGFNFQTVGVHFDAAGIPIYASAAIDYTTI